MHYTALEFEKPIFEIEKRLEELRTYSPNNKREIDKLERKRKHLQDDLFKSLTPWQITQIARHPQRPYTLDYIELICDEFIELHGDRSFKDDLAIVGGIAKIDGQSVIVVGHQKGRTTKEKITRNFGMPHPEGFRKALRLMRMAERFVFPVITLIDTPGAYPGIGAEERGQAEAIAENLETMSSLKVPIVTVVIGEGGSGGALALGVGDRVLMMEYAVYSTISPEGCAAILWKDGSKAELAAKALKLTSKNLLKLKVIDGIIKEPPGCAHKDYKAASKNLKEAIMNNLKPLLDLPVDTLREERYKKFREMGQFLVSQE
jgi:acetyl-CoA carboxylase carboxyl transferase subunit alpha